MIFNANDFKEEIELAIKHAPSALQAFFRWYVLPTLAQNAPLLVSHAGTLEGGEGHIVHSRSHAVLQPTAKGHKSRGNVLLYDADNKKFILPWNHTLLPENEDASDWNKWLEAAFSRNREELL